MSELTHLGPRLHEDDVAGVIAGSMEGFVTEHLKTMKQTAPWPVALQELVEKAKYRDGWAFMLYDEDRGQGSEGLTLEIRIKTVDTYHPERWLHIRHLFIVPAASYNMRSWRRWLFEQILLVERHEAAEFFQIDGVRPYAPNHGPGHDPYIIFEEGTVQEKRTSYQGVERDTDAPTMESV